MTTSPDLQTRLAQAANLGDLDECRRLLAAGADPTFADADKFTPLHEAAQGGHPAVCALLIEAGASLDAVDKTRNTPLHEAARFNHPDVVRTLVKAGAELERPAFEGRTPLCQAALYGSKDALEALIDVGADVNARIEHDTSRSESGKKLGYLKLDIGVAVETKFSASPRRTSRNELHHAQPPRPPGLRGTFARGRGRRGRKGSNHRNPEEPVSHRGRASFGHRSDPTQLRRHAGHGQTARRPRVAVGRLSLTLRQRSGCAQGPARHGHRGLSVEPGLRSERGRSGGHGEGGRGRGGGPPSGPRDARHRTAAALGRTVESGPTRCTSSEQPQHAFHGDRRCSLERP